MKKILQFIHSGKGRHAAGQRRKTRAQSLVEFAITLPMLVLLFSGLVEFGFALNYYLSLLDATREAARYASNWDPYLRDPGGNVTGDDTAFYSNTSTMVLANLDPHVLASDYVGRRIILDSATDDVLVTVFARAEDGTVIRSPTSGTFHQYPHPGSTSRFIEADIASRFEPGSPAAGLVLVEVHYNYHQRLAIPYLAPFLPNPLLLKAYTIMPLSAAEPAGP